MMLWLVLLRVVDSILSSHVRVRISLSDGHLSQYTPCYCTPVYLLNTYEYQTCERVLCAYAEVGVEEHSVVMALLFAGVKEAEHLTTITATTLTSAVMFISRSHLYGLHTCTEKNVQESTYVCVRSHQHVGMCAAS